MAMKPFVDQKVVVLQAHAGGANADGTVVRKGTTDIYKGKWWVQLEGYDFLMPVEEERIVDAKVFHARERAKRAHPPKDG